jgi:hypothetical protein
VGLMMASIRVKSTPVGCLSPPSYLPRPDFHPDVKGPIFYFPPIGAYSRPDFWEALMHVQVSPATRRYLVNVGDRVGTANAYLVIALMVGAMIAELFLSIVHAYYWVASDY